MTQLTYYVGVDSDRDGFTCQGVADTDPLNLIPTAAAHWGINASVHSSATSVTHTRAMTRYGAYYYRVVTGTNTAAGMRFGDDGTTIDDIPVTASTTYSACLWVRGVSDYAGVGMTLEVTNQSGTVLASNTFIISSTAWQQVTALNWSSGVGASHIAFRVRKTSSATNMSFDVTGFMLVTGSSVPSAFNAGSASNQYDDITTYVRSASWTNGHAGMTEADALIKEGVAPEARLTLELDNKEGWFNVETTGTELLTNNDFTSWSGDNPTGWTVTGESGTDPYVNEVGAGESQGGSGNNFCNLYTTSAQIQISQNILTVGERYVVTIEIDTATTGGIRAYCGSTPVSLPYFTSGLKTFTFIASDTSFIIQNYGACDITLAMASVKQTSRYYGLSRETLFTIFASHGAVIDQQLYEGQMERVDISVGNLADRKVTVTCTDAMLTLQGVETSPQYRTNVRVNDLIDTLFDEAVILWPAASVYWILGSERGSILGLTTVLFDAVDLLALSTGTTLLGAAGDVNSPAVKDLNARAYLDDLMSVEMVGRFYFDTRRGRFTFLNRLYDNDNDTVVYNLTDDDFEVGDYRYADLLLNTANVNYTPRSEGTPASVIWRSPKNITVQRFATVSITARYQDPDQRAAKVAAREIIDPVRGTDYTLSISDPFLRVKVRITKGAQSSVIEITNESKTNEVTVSGLQIRGTPIYTYDRQMVNAMNASSVYDNGSREKTFNVAMLGDEETAYSYARSLSTRFGYRRARFASIMFNLNKTDTRAAMALGIALGNQITIAASDGHNGRYAVAAEKHVLRAGGEHTHNVTWVLKPVDGVVWWNLGTSGKSELGMTTTLSF